MAEPIVNISCVANLYSRMMYFKNVGDIEFGHTHQFDHLTLLASGAVRVNVDGVETVFSAPHMIYIHKDKSHEFTALEAGTVAFCIHALRNGDDVGDIIDPASIPNGVNVMEMAKPLVKIT